MLPPRSEQSKILEFIDSETRELNTFLFRIQNEIDLIRDYRTRLIADVSTGKVDIRHISQSTAEDLTEPVDPYDNIGNEALLAEDEPEFVEEAGE